MEIDPNSPLPKYYQLRELLRSKIESGAWEPGDMIPPERELCASYNISRMTVRQALNDLVNEGLLVREQGRGTFVAMPKIQQAFDRLTGFTDEMAAHGRVPTSRVLRLEVESPRTGIQTALALPAKRQVVVLERLRLADDEPVNLETAWLHFDGCQSLLDEDFEYNSLYKILSTQYGVVPTRAEQYLEAAVGRRREQQLLHFQSGSPVLLARRITYDQNDQPFEYVESIYRADRYTFYMALTSGSQDASQWRPLFDRTEAAS